MDNGPDVNLAFANINRVGFEWCVHLLTCAIGDAFGLSIAPGRSKHPAARAVIRSMKKDVEHIKTLDRAKVKRAAMLREGGDVQTTVNAFDPDVCYRPKP